MASKKDLNIMNAKDCSALGLKIFKVMMVKEKYIQTVKTDILIIILLKSILLRIVIQCF